MIYYFTPFSAQKRLGHIHNQYCALVPNDDDWICLMDPDAMFLYPFQQKWIEDILDDDNGEHDLLGCVTNRVGLQNQTLGNVAFSDINIQNHIRIAQGRKIHHKYIIEETDLIAGFFMLFKKSLWNKIKFEESIQFDMKFCNAVKAAGGRIGIMKGIYVWHSYRLNSGNIKDKSHLIN